MVREITPAVRENAPKGHSRACNAILSPLTKVWQTSENKLQGSIYTHSPTFVQILKKIPLQVFSGNQSLRESRENAPPDATQFQSDRISYKRFIQKFGGGK